MLFNKDTDPNEFFLIQYLCPSKNTFKLKHVPTDTYLVGQDKRIGFKIINDEYLTKYLTKYYGTIFYQNSSVVLTEFCDRYSIRDIMDYKEITLTEDQICIIIHDLLQSIKEIHKRRILYESVKSSNIFIRSDGSLKVDAYHVLSEQIVNKRIYTPPSIYYWSSPQYLTPGKKHHSWDDIWSIGCTAIELAEGRPPYYEFNKDEFCFKVTSEGFPGFRKGTHHSELFKHFVKRCMAFRGDQRATVTELLSHPFIRKAEKFNRMKVLEKSVIK